MYNNFAVILLTYNLVIIIVFLVNGAYSMCDMKKNCSTSTKIYAHANKNCIWHLIIAPVYLTSRSARYPSSNMNKLRTGGEGELNAAILDKK